MYWIPKTAGPPLNSQPVVVYNEFHPGEFTLAVWYDAGTTKDDGNPAVFPGFYKRGKSGNRVQIRNGVSYYLPLDIPRPSGEEHKKQYRQGYQAALLWVFSRLEAMSQRETAGGLWVLNNLAKQIEDQIMTARVVNNL